MIGWVSKTRIPEDNIGMEPEFPFSRGPIFLNIRFPETTYI